MYDKIGRLLWNPIMAITVYTIQGEDISILDMFFWQ